MTKTRYGMPHILRIGRIAVLGAFLGMQPGCSNDPIYVDHFDGAPPGWRPRTEPLGDPADDRNVYSPSDCTQSPFVANRRNPDGRSEPVLMFERVAGDTCPSFLWAISAPVTLDGGKRRVRIRAQKLHPGGQIVNFGYRDIVYLALKFENNRILWQARPVPGPDWTHVGYYTDDHWLTVNMFMGSDKTYGLSIFDLDARIELVSIESSFGAHPDFVFFPLVADLGQRLYLRAVSEPVGQHRFYLDEIYMHQTGQ